ncbi:MAG: alkaline phosphatase family protein [Candidatus Heimdallarchaeota archaeon]
MKTLLVGWDGASHNLVQKWLERLPNLRKIARRGVFTPLQTTPLVISSCAWSTLATGLNAGKHGIYDFYRDFTTDNSYFRMPISSKMRAGLPFWKILNFHEHSIGLVNVPVTYPAEKVKGFMVTGPMTPEMSQPGICYPPGLLDAFNKENYIMELYDAKERPRDEIIQETHNIVASRMELIRFLLSKHKVDLLFVVFTMIDRFSHLFWHYYDESHPYRKTETPDNLSKYRDSLFDLYKLLDSSLGELEALFSPSHVIIVSDHGFRALKNLVQVNKVLDRLGWLSFKPKTEWDRVSNTRLNLEVPYIYGKVDWSRTQAYSIGRRGAVYLNLEAREPMGIVSRAEYQQIVHQLKEALEKELEGIVDNVILRNEVFWGPYIDKAPDLILKLKEGYYPLGYAYFLDEEEYIFENTIKELPIETGIEDKEGILVAAGPSIIKSQDIEAGLTDIAPTILYLYGCPIPAETDGKVLPIFDHKPIPQRKNYPEKDRSEFDYDEEEAETVRKRLESLGYI